MLEADRIEAVMRAVWSRHGLQPRGDDAHLFAGGGAFADRHRRGDRHPARLPLPALDAGRASTSRRAALRDAVPTIDVGLVWRRGSRTREVVQEFIEIAREQARSGRLR